MLSDNLIISKDPYPNYRPCAGIVLFNKHGKVFIGKRVLGVENQESCASLEDKYLWQMPQGGICSDEIPAAAALRELQEETNIVSVTILDEAPFWLSYDVPGGYKDKYLGQTQKWFACRFNGDDNEIDVINIGNHRNEFTAWKWEDIYKLPDLVVPFKYHVYKKIVELFSHFSKG